MRPLFPRYRWGRKKGSLKISFGWCCAELTAGHITHQRLLSDEYRSVWVQIKHQGQSDFQIVRVEVHVHDLTCLGYVSQAWEIQNSSSSTAFVSAGVISASHHCCCIPELVYQITRRFFLTAWLHRLLQLGLVLCANKS